MLLLVKKIPAGTGLIHASDTMVASQVEYDKMMLLKEEAENVSKDEQELVIDEVISQDK